MTETPQQPHVPVARRHWWAYAVVIAVWVSYIVLTVLAPSTGATSAVTIPAVVQLAVTLGVIVSLLVFWLLALRGAEIFKRYARVIGDETEGQAINVIANGLIWTLVYITATQLWGATLAYWAHTPYLQAAALIRDHMPVALTVIAFVTLYRGSRLLLRTAGLPLWNRTASYTLLGYAAVAVLILWLFMTEKRADTGLIPAYSLPLPVLFFTVGLPYVTGWGLGLLAALNISAYSRRVQGVIYRQALRDLARGVMTVALFLTTYALVGVLSHYLLALPLWLILLIFWVLVGLYGLAFWFVRRGAIRLLRIETIQQ